MQFKLFRHLWGIETSWEQAFPRIKAEGFVGIESPPPAPPESHRFKSLLSTYGFEFIAQGFTVGDGVDAHLKSFRQQLALGKELGAVQMTVHSGSDAWSASESAAFYEQAIAIECESGMAVGHETHRGRVFFNPWATRDILQKFDHLKLVCDFSHWVCVAERPDWDDATGSILKLCAERCLHLHARVGYPEGPQVPDPSAPEYQNMLDIHEKWWETIWRSQLARGLKATTVTPEFGPPGYLHTLPHTNVPVADLWKICKFMADRLTRRFQTNFT